MNMKVGRGGGGRGISPRCHLYRADPFFKNEYHIQIENIL